MSTIARFLAAKQPLFDQALQQLEDRTGHTGVDARLAAEIAGLAADRTRQLGLQADCSGPELYQALLGHLEVDDRQLATQLGGRDPQDLAQMAPLIMDRIDQLDMPRRGFFLKADIAAALLAAQPPRAIMQRLGYTSVEDMTAAEDIHELYLALRFGQDADWLNGFNQLYAKLTPQDFETRDIKVVRFDHAKWGDIAADFTKKKLHNITHSKEIGAIALLPVKNMKVPGVTMTVMPLVLHYYNEVRLYSAFFKLMRGKRDFGQIVADTLIADVPEVKLLSGQHIHWRVIQRYFGKLKNEEHPEIFEPHVSPEDLHWRRAEELLVQIDPRLAFWHGLDFVAAVKGEEAVTFNLMDVSFSYSNRLGYADRVLYHFRESLWNEVFSRYLGQRVLEEQVLERLDNDFIAPEKLAV